ncbi:DUF3375 domain-containing protein [Dactylosporangium cerinum]|uniref:DUF3375 domain-containing protein n=1 Tax=Dactylosporangium cerinum TaxID=1434730 RepID=A0ABV9VL59_9ACTN
MAFLGKVFVDENARSVPAVELAARLDDELSGFNEQEPRFPRPARAYLDDWAHADADWLRKYYPAGSDEAHFDATPAVEKALAWVRSLQARSFVGTESRLNIVFELLRQMAFGAETDPDVRLTELYRRRAEIDEEIARIRGGELPLLDDTAQRDRYQQFTSTARDLLADFREVEANFRALDRELRERVALWNGSKGAFLDEVLGDRSTIADPDQGRSFHAFYDFLLSHARQAEFTTLLDRVQALPGIGGPDPRMRRIHYDWLDAAERTQATVRLLSEQLRRFLDDQVWLENRRVMDLLRSIETHALRLRRYPDATLTTEIGAATPTIVLPMERPLYRPRSKAALDNTATEDPQCPCGALAWRSGPLRCQERTGCPVGSGTIVGVRGKRRRRWTIHMTQTGVSSAATKAATAFHSHRGAGNGVGTDDGPPPPQSWPAGSVGEVRARRAGPGDGQAGRAGVGP